MKPAERECCRYPLTSRASQEDATVRALVAEYGTKKWSQIASQLPGRLGKQCRERCVLHVCNDAYSDSALLTGPHVSRAQLVQSLGPSNCERPTRKAAPRRIRTVRVALRPISDLQKRGPWTEEEDRLIIDMQHRMGNKWAEIADEIPGR